jgi:hypothetical protein
MGVFIIAFVSLLAELSHQVSPNLIAMAGELAPTSVRLHRKSDWTGCGGNLVGSAAPHFADGNCFNDCRACGASTHWKCCGNPDENAIFCKAFSKESCAKAAKKSLPSKQPSKARERLLKVSALTLAGEEAATVEVGVYSRVLDLKAALKEANKKLMQFEATYPVCNAFKHSSTFLKPNTVLANHTNQVLLLNGKKPLPAGMLLRNAFRAVIAEHDAGVSSLLFGDEHAAGGSSRSCDNVLSSIDVTVSLIQLPPTFEHKGSWSGCGGNPQGVSESRGCGNCSPACSECGASSHWSCCGSTFRKGKLCAMGTTEEQALTNAKLCYDPVADGAAPVYCF